MKDDSKKVGFTIVEFGASDTSSCVSSTASGIQHRSIITKFLRRAAFCFVNPRSSIGRKIALLYMTALLSIPIIFLNVQCAVSLSDLTPILKDTRAADRQVIQTD